MALAINDYFVSDATRLLDEVLFLMRVTGRMSALIDKGEAQEGVGYNYQSLLWDRSTAADSAVWTPIQGNDGGGSVSPNTCEPVPLQSNPANTVYNYELIQTRLHTNDLCMWDVRQAYKFEEQVMYTRDNFKALIVDVWERQDKTAFFQLPGHKLVCNANLTDYFGASDYGSALPTSKLTAGILHTVYEQQIRDAGGEEPVAMKDAAPMFTLLISPEQQGNVLQNDPLVREDIRFAQMGEGESGWLLQSWNCDRPYAGFLMAVDPKMPRWNYDFGAAQWVEVPFYISVATTNGSKLVPNPAYRTAFAEDIYLWMKQTIRRDMPKPLGSGGSDAKFNPVNWNGEIEWVNFRSNDNNQMGLLGSWWACLAAAYRPEKPQFSWILRALNCSPAYLINCY